MKKYLPRKKMGNLSMFHHIFMHQHRRHEIEPTICSFRNLKAQYNNLASERKKDSFEFDGIKNMKSAVGGLRPIQFWFWFWSFAVFI